MENTKRKFSIKRVQALEEAINQYRESIQEEPTAHEQEVLAVLQNMVDQLNKASVKGVSQARRRNLELAENLLEVLPKGKSMTANEIMGLGLHGFNIDNNGNISHQHVTAVLRLMEETGKITSCKVGRTKVYTVL